MEALQQDSGSDGVSTIRARRTSVPCFRLDTHVPSNMTTGLDIPSIIEDSVKPSEPQKATKVASLTPGKKGVSHRI